MRVLVRIPVIFALLGAIMSLSCSEDITSARNTKFSAEESLSVDVELKTRTALRVVGINGAIDVTGVPGASDISIVAVKRVESHSVEDAEAHLGQIAVDVDSATAEVIVQTDQPEKTEGRNYIVNYTISIPPDFVVNIGEVNGDVTVQSISGDVAIVIANGRVEGDVLEGNTSMNVGNGQIDATVTMPLGGRINLSVGNGDIDLHIPQSTSAEFAATVSNGTIKITNLTLSNRIQTRRSVTGTLGGGGGFITLGVANGTIEAIGF